MVTWALAVRRRSAASWHVACLERSSVPQPDALAKFRDSNGWTVGADANVAIAKVGANGSIDTMTAQQPVVQFVLNNVGLTAGVSLEGSKISRYQLG
jgi:lipid-binding SYLF domain-containing protein